MRAVAGIGVVLGAIALTGCGSSGSDKPKDDAHSAAVQRRVGAYVIKQTEKRIEDQTGAFVDPELTGPTKADCIPESDTKLSCLVNGSARAGFEDTADPNAEGDFQWKWEVIVDPDTGRYQAQPTQTQLPGG